MKSIEELQKEKNKTNLQLAKLLNISPSTYCDKKKGRRKFQPMEIVILCQYFGATVEQISDFLIRDTR